MEGLHMRLKTPVGVLRKAETRYVYKRTTGLQFRIGGSYQNIHEADTIGKRAGRVGRITIRAERMIELLPFLGLSPTRLQLKRP